MPFIQSLSWKLLGINQEVLFYQNPVSNLFWPVAGLNERTIFPPQLLEVLDYLKFITLARRMWGSTFVLKTIFRRSICLKLTERVWWTIRTHSEEVNWARRQTFYKLNSRSSSFGLSIDRSYCTLLCCFISVFLLHLFAFSRSADAASPLEVYKVVARWSPNNKQDVSRGRFPVQRMLIN